VSKRGLSLRVMAPSCAVEETRARINTISPGIIITKMAFVVA
jgi:hypothetical protein